jgi:hypothetical protein
MRLFIVPPESYEGHPQGVFYLWGLPFCGVAHDFGICWNLLQPSAVDYRVLETLDPLVRFSQDGDLDLVYLEQNR